MATVNIKFFRPHIVDGVTAVFGIDSATPETFTSSAASQVTTASVPDNVTLIRITATGGDVWVTFGESPTAVTQTGTLILQDLPEIFKLPQGYKVALIN